MHRSRLILLPYEPKFQSLIKWVSLVLCSIVKETEEGNEEDPDVIVPELDEEDQRSFEVVRKIIEGYPKLFFSVSFLFGWI